MKKILITSSAIAILASAYSVSAVAATDLSSFKKVDSDSDGYISKYEAKVRKDLNENWKSIDKDKNGKIDISEFSAFEGIEATPSKATAKATAKATTKATAKAIAKTPAKTPATTK